MISLLYFARLDTALIIYQFPSGCLNQSNVKYENRIKIEAVKKKNNLYFAQDLYIKSELKFCNIPR